MRCVLAAMGFRNKDSLYNKNVIINTMIKYADAADIILFGEAFLQGFYGVNFDVAHDEKIAITKDDAIIKEICSVAERYSVAVSFGFIEKSGEYFFSSQMTIDSAGQIIDIYRRVSPGWKEPFAGSAYREGECFQAFAFRNKRIVVGLCGDLWFEENIKAINELMPELVFWPVYTDYSYNAWNKTVKHEYAEQAGKIDAKVLYVNSVCLDKDADDIAKGGAAVFCKGAIEKEIPSGREEVFVVEV